MPISGKKHNPFYQAQAILSRRDHAESEMREKLARKGFSDAQVESAVVWLKENNLLDDAIFARKYSESILLSKPVGPNWLRLKLRQRGVGTEVIDSTLAHIYEVHEQSELAQAAIQSWMRMYPNKAGNRPALWRFLASRGFYPDVITQCLEDAQSEIQPEDELKIGE